MGIGLQNAPIHKSTGIAFIGEDLYAVDDAGGFYLITDYDQPNDPANGTTAAADYIETVIGVGYRLRSDL